MEGVALSGTAHHGRAVSPGMGSPPHCPPTFCQAAGPSAEGPQTKLTTLSAWAEQTLHAGPGLQSFLKGAKEEGALKAKEVPRMEDNTPHSRPRDRAGCLFLVDLTGWSLIAGGTGREHTCFTAT